jgi:hypothetical protein
MANFPKLESLMELAKIDRIKRFEVCSLGVDKVLEAHMA